MSTGHWVVTVHRNGSNNGREIFHTRRELMEAVAAIAGSIPKEGNDSITIHVHLIGR